jgi:ABC-2 type transport system ATP-binding protein
MDESQQYMIRVEHVTQHYSVRPILRDVTFEVARGEQVSVVGPNGMGKSTLLGVLAGILWPIDGYVEIDGRRRRSSVEAEQAIRRLVYYLPDQPWLPSQRTGREFLVAVGELYEVPYKRLFDHVDRVLSLFELDQHGDHIISGYSNGQKHKLAVAGALVSEAPVLLLDEPFGGGLDPAGIIALKEVFQHPASRGDVTVVMTTPVPALVAEVATRVLVLREGRVTAYATPDELRGESNAPTIEIALQRLVFPESVENLKRYFEEKGK